MTRTSAVSADGRRYRVVAAALAFIVAALTGQATAQPNDATAAGCGPVLAGYEWQARSGIGHPLVGAVVFPDRTVATSEAPSVRSERGASDELLRAVAQRHGFVLLGEVHDNPDHHALRAALLAASACTDPAASRAAVFEHIRADQKDALAPLDGPPGPTADALLDRLDWPRSGWPAAAMFRPLFASVLAARMTIVPGEPASGAVRSVARNGLGNLSAAEQSRLVLDKPLPSLLAQALDRQLADSHCGMVLPGPAVAGLALAQRYRDAHLAAAMVTAAATHDTVVLLSGNGHVRTDRGVPWYLAQARPAARIYTVMFLEVEDGRDDPQSYVPRDPEGRPAADAIVFTPRAERPDPCAEMRALKRGG